MLFLEKGRVCICARARVCLCVRERGRVCAVSGLAIEPCQTPRAKPSLLDRNCLFTGYTTVYLKTIGLAGLLQRTPCRYRYQASGSCFTTCLLCAIFFFFLFSEQPLLYEISFDILEFSTVILFAQFQTSALFGSLLNHKLRLFNPTYLVI